MASWTTPRSASIGDIYTAAWYNTYTRDEFDSIQGLGVVGQPYGTTTSGPGANGAKYVKIWARGFAVTSFEINIDTSAGNIDVGLYTDTAGVPGTRLWSRGSVASPGTGQQSFLISAGSPAALTLPSGPCWAAAAGSSASLALKGSGGAPKGISKAAATAFPLAATAPSVTDNNDIFAVILL